MKTRQDRNNTVNTISFVLRIVAALALVPIAVADEKSIQMIPLENHFTALSLGQGGKSAIVLEESSGRVALVEIESGAIVQQELPELRNVTLLPLPEGPGHLVIGSTQPDKTRFYHIDPGASDGQASFRTLDLPFVTAGAALGRDMLLFLRSSDLAALLRVDLCGEIELVIESCRTRSSKVEKTKFGMALFEFLGPPVTDLVVDPQSNILIAAQRGTSFVLGLDSRQGQFLFANALEKFEPLRLAGAIGERASVFVSAPRAGWIEIFDIDRDFRDLSPSGRIDLGGLADTAMLTISLDELAGMDGSGSNPAAWERLAGKVAVGPDQDILFIASIRPGTIHVVERTGSTNKHTLDIRTESNEILDFALSPDGGHLGILLDGMLIVSPVHLELAAITESGDVDRGGGIDEAELAIASALQTRLSGEGFYRGVVDGVWGPESQAALTRFQVQNGIVSAPADDPMQADAITLGALYTEHLEIFPVDVFGPERTQKVREAAFARFFAQSLPEVQYFSPSEIYMKGKEAATVKCGLLNALPEEAIWPAILPTVRQLEALRTEIGTAFEVLSSFQTADYADCSGTPKELIAPHGAFMAIEFTVKGRRATPEAAEQYAKLIGGSNGVTVRAGTGSFHIAVSPDTEPRERLGVWHAVIASYRPSARGCAEAQADVVEFANLLGGTGLAGAQIYIARTAISDHYAVTVDFGGSQEEARQAVSVIRNVASQSADTRTGADSFPQINEGWRIDDRCRRVSVLD